MPLHWITERLSDLNVNGTLFVDETSTHENTLGSQACHGLFEDNPIIETGEWREIAPAVPANLIQAGSASILNAVNLLLNSDTGANGHLRTSLGSGRGSVRSNGGIHQTAIQESSDIDSATVSTHVAPRNKDHVRRTIFKDGSFLVDMLENIVQPEETLNPTQITQEDEHQPLAKSYVPQSASSTEPDTSSQSQEFDEAVWSTCTTPSVAEESNLVNPSRSTSGKALSSFCNALDLAVAKPFLANNLPAFYLDLSVTDARIR